MIRQATKKDTDSIMQIWLDTNIKAHFYIPKSFWMDQADKVRSLLPEADIYVFEENSKILGFIGVLFYNYIAGIFVADTYTHRGIGTALIKKVQELYPQLELNVYQKNKNAICFYQKNGFKIQKEGYNSDTNEPEYFMSWHKTQY